MTLSKNNLFARYYNWIYGSYAKDVCSFFWGSLYAIGVFFFVVPGRLLLNSSDDRNKPGAQFFLGLVAWVIYFVCVLVGNSIIERFGYEFINLFYTLVAGGLLGAVVVAGGLALVVGMVVGGIKTQETVKETSFVQNTSDFVGAIRRKHCTKITYK